MLEAIRKRSAGIVVKGLLGLLILSFAMWGIADVFSPGGTNQTLATVGDIEIQPDQVRREYQREIERLSNVFGTRLEPEQARMFGIAQVVVQRVVNRTLYDLGAADLGVLVNDDLVRRNIRDFSGFKNAKGEFERARFQQLLQSNRLSEAAYVEMTRGDIGRAQYLSMVNSQSLSPKRLVQALYSHRNEKRIAETVTFKYDAVSNVADPDGATLAKYHEENAQRYTAPEYRNLTFVSLTAEQIAKEIAVSDDTIARAYEDRIGEFSDPEKRDLQQIKFKDEATARAAYDRLKTGDDYLKVAKELANMEAAATQLGEMKQSELLPGLAEAAFSLQPDGYSEPIKSVLGWHILRLKGVIAARSKSLEEVSPELKKQIAAEQAIDSLYNLANRLEDELGGGSSLEEAALALNLPIKTQGDIDKNGLTPAGTKVEGLPDANFLDVAFSTANSQESALTESGDDGYFIVRVNSVTEPALKPLDSVRSQIIGAWKAEQRREQASKSGQELITAVKAGGDLAKTSAEKGLTMTTTEPVGRNDGGALPRELITKLFEAKPGDTVSAAGTTGYIVARLKEIQAADALVAVDEVKSLSSEINSSIRGDLMSQLANGLRLRFPVSINTDAVNAQF